MLYIKIQKDIYIFKFIVGMNLVVSHHTIHDVIKMGNIVVKKTVIKWLVRQKWNDRDIYIITGLIRTAYTEIMAK